MSSKLLRISVASIAFLVAFASTPPARAFSEVSFEFFQSSLSPHGRWEFSASFGQVWHPYVEVAHWHPYSYGHWVYTDVGQTWVSDYTWGSVPYHYGTWAVEPGRGWVWVPGDVWAPSWVVFRLGSDVIGWAPVAPGFAIGASVGVVAEEESVFLYVPSRQFFAPQAGDAPAPARRQPGVFRAHQRAPGAQVLAEAGAPRHVLTIPSLSLPLPGCAGSWLTAGIPVSVGAWVRS